MLREPDGLDYSAKVWGWGFTILIVSAVGVSLAAPLFIHLAMPPEYLAAARYIPWLVGICVLNELAALCSVGCYARNNSSLVLAVNGAAAVVAVAGYLLLIPSYGIEGAIAATILAHFLRIGLFIWLGHKSAPIAYPFAATAGSPSRAWPRDATCCACVRRASAPPTTRRRRGTRASR